MGTEKFSITRYVPEILKSLPEKRLTARELAQIIMERFPEAVAEKQRRSSARIIPLNTPDAMMQQIVAEIGAQRKGIQKKDNRIKTTEGRPRKYYFTEREDSEEVEDTSIEKEGSPEHSGAISVVSLQEADLYPLLTEYLFSELGVYSKRIDERKSSNSRGRGGNRWLYPDVVAMEELSSSWHREVIDCAKEYFDKKTKLWSFEVKLKLNGSNVRESYFQAVSNSSWANLGYLVAAEIEGVNTLEELRMLSGIHGIGVIKMDIDNLSESQILIPARERQDVDWNSINRLVEENPDFLSFVKLIRQFYQTGDPRKSDWDHS